MKSLNVSRQVFEKSSWNRIRISIVLPLAWFHQSILSRRMEILQL